MSIDDKEGDFATPAGLSAGIEGWPIAGRFVTARGARTEVQLLVVTVASDGATGRGEAFPHSRYGETATSALAAVEAMAEAISGGVSRNALRRLMPAGAARNAIDCALLDLEAKLKGKPAAALAGIGAMHPVETAFTISLDEPELMGEAARRAAGRPVLKIKLGAAGDPARLAAVRRAAPGARLIADANEGWTAATLRDNLLACADAGVELLEQPLPAASDALLAELDHPVPVCADESFHGDTDPVALAGRYDAVNIKLDKTGGVTAALDLAGRAADGGLLVMVGCMVATSLSMAPALLPAQRAHFTDLDGPLLLARDRSPGLDYRGSLIMPAPPGLWG